MGDVTQLPAESAGETSDPDDLRGLSDAEVAERVATGQVNQTEARTSRSVREIIRGNVLTRFNAILGTLLLIVLLTGRFVDALFGFVLISNLAIGVGQEIRAKRTLDRLSVLHAPRCHVRRGGETREIPIDDVVLDDLLELSTGDQVPADGTVLQVDGLEVDESLLTGESDPVSKQTNDDVFSGSFVVAGRSLVRTTAVGDDAYARRITAEARQFSLTRSELRAAIDRILRVLTWVIILSAPLVIWSRWRLLSDEGGDWREAVARTVAALGGMIPEGLVLLTSLTMMVAAVAMVRRKVLVQELSAVEGLARVDVVCLDKTGTLTDGLIRLDRIETVNGSIPGEAFEAPDADASGPSVPDGSTPEAVAAMAAIAALPDPNATMRAVAAAIAAPEGWTTTNTVPFSSARKWSAASFEGHGTWIVGAPEIVGTATGDERLADRIDELAATGRRVLLLAYSDEPATFSTLPDDLRPAALCILSENIREDAPDTLRYFEDQGVRLKLISGDNPTAVAAIASEVGMDTGTPIDARELPDDPEKLEAMVDTHHVYGRVNPDQKRALVRALQARGHTVAMTGDGVNDTLALKDANIGVSMGSGASATRATSQLVLMDDRFAQLPRVVAEGRRVINNIERVANLYLVRNMYSFVVAIYVSLTLSSYPFLPRQLSLITATTYGIPSFFLALAAFQGRHQPGFLGRVLRFSIPTGALIAVGILTADRVAQAWGATELQGDTASLIALLTGGLVVLARVSRPLRPWKILMVAAMALLAIAAFVTPPVQDLLDLDPAREATTAGLLMGLSTSLVAVLIGRWTDRPTDDARQPPAAAEATGHT
jgi:cation-transporting P-type ATPase E